MTSKRRAICLMDGGLGQELIRRQPGPAHELWSAKVMLDTPAAVGQIHRDFIAAGARLITLNTYAVTPERLQRFGLESCFADLHAQAGRQAAEACAGQPGVTRAGCLPPLVVSYRPDQTLPLPHLQATYRQLVEQQCTWCDLFICETMSCIAEARTATEQGVASGMPVWTAFTLDDGNGRVLRSGEPLEAGLAAAVHAGASAILVNCCRPESVMQAMPVLSQLSVPFGAYANGFVEVAGHGVGRTVDALHERHDLTPARYAEHAMCWVDAGASIIGGCCHIGPEHIARLHGDLLASGYEIVSGLSISPGSRLDEAA